MARSHRTLSVITVAAVVVTGGLAYGGTRSADGIAPWQRGRVAIAPDAANPAPWQAAHRSPLVPAGGSEPTNDLVPLRMPLGWRQVARGVYATTSRPGRGPVVFVLRSNASVSGDPWALRRVASREARAWRSVEAAHTTVEVGPVFGAQPGVVRSHRTREPLPSNGGHARYSRVEIRTARIEQGTFMAVGVDAVDRPGSASQIAAMVDSLRPR